MKGHKNHYPKRRIKELKLLPIPHQIRDNIGVLINRKISTKNHEAIITIKVKKVNLI
jgi:hypothetical protein